MAGPYNYLDRGIDPTQMRSESTENELMRRQLPMYPPVTVLGDLIGRFNEPTAQYNALLEAVRARLLQKMTQTGAPATDNFGASQNYGK